MDKYDMQREIDKMKGLLMPESIVHDAAIQLVKLIEVMVEYLEENVG